jgi:hypothetical protein
MSCRALSAADPGVGQFVVTAHEQPQRRALRYLRGGTAAARAGDRGGDPHRTRRGIQADQSARLGSELTLVRLDLVVLDRVVHSQLGAVGEPVGDSVREDHHEQVLQVAGVPSELHSGAFPGGALHLAPAIYRGPPAGGMGGSQTW